ncbi:MAG: PDZ domain-containing protein [Gemmatimonadetes bacterium]|nr:PDZ domain-containing protein [Gemmatimonadota bacterium]NIR77500.1 PDZ domain-containing protein [Gemmatimonadota bacterium]NIT87398.1 PDZ domain-containing protein [Gemmatimonadota bacterium]NIU31254.1 PDZ domain-containing protein [Gemmatimonadota bacterium]NIU34860.1 PDZ domain-containing protein [Gemmatimonadota bacterium]
MAVLACGLLWVATANAAGQEQPEPQAREGERCVCVDVEGIRERALAAAGRRALLGVGIDIEQGADDDALGVRVTDVAEDGPAADAGLREDDVIVAIDGRSLVEPLADAEEEDDLDRHRSLPVQRLVRILSDHEPGDEVRVAYLRQGERRTATVELAAFGAWRRFGSVGGPHGFDRPLPPGAPPTPGVRIPKGDPHILQLRRGPGGPMGFGPTGRRLGLRVTDLNSGLGKYFGTEEGVLVLEVAEGSTLGIRPGDVIQTVGERTVEEAEDVHRILASYEEGEEVRFQVRRNGRELTVTGTTP